jgi:hypothetical protein
VKDLALVFDQMGVLCAERPIHATVLAVGDDTS